MLLNALELTDELLIKLVSESREPPCLNWKSLKTYTQLPQISMTPGRKPCRVFHDCWVNEQGTVFLSEDTSLALEVLKAYYNGQEIPDKFKDRLKKVFGWV